jgi:DNA-binding IclR family transcriptional regulator
MAAAPRYDVTVVSLPFVRRLSQRSEESAFFSARRGDETICLTREEGSFPLRSHVLHEGARFPLGVVSAGMAVLAFLPDTEIEQYLNRVELTREWGSQHRKDEVWRHVALTRQNGYSLNPGLVVEGSWGMAAAVFKDGQPQWALSLTGVEQRFTPQRQAELGPLLLREANALSRELTRRDAAKPTTSAGSFIR